MITGHATPRPWAIYAAATARYAADVTSALTAADLVDRRTLGVIYTCFDKVVPLDGLLECNPMRRPMSFSDRLAELARARRKGRVTEAEYEAKRRDILTGS